MDFTNGILRPDIVVAATVSSNLLNKFYSLIEPLGKDRIDLFARTTRLGWDCWGNEV